VPPLELAAWISAALGVASLLAALVAGLWKYFKDKS
jgi:hypothetical protein